jgi:benzaldehyde dehydrogenase (NAD)
VTEAAASSIDTALAAVEAASAAFKAWSRCAPSYRRDLLLEASNVMLAKKDEFIRAVADETGCSAIWGGFNVQLAANMLREAAGLTTKVSGELIPSDVPGMLAMGMRVPAGVVLGIGSWNAPVILATRAVAVPLACGNTVVLKGSEVCPATHGLVASVFQEAGFPQGVVNYITNAPEDAGPLVRAVIEHRAVRRVNYTGSTRVGRIIGEICGRELKPCLLELGGKAPVIILEDADIDEAVEACSFGAFVHSGQTCMSSERILVADAIADEFVRKFAAKASSLSLGDPRKGDYVLGSVVDRTTVERCNRLVADARSKGATVVCGGEEDSTVMRACVVDRVTPEMDIFYEETFGPLKAVVRFNDVDEAIQLANEGEFGLSSAIFSRDITKALDIVREIDSGICHINGATVHDEAQMPFGGVKSSGFGRFGGLASIPEFTDVRWVSIQSGKRHYPF